MKLLKENIFALCRMAAALLAAVVLLAVTGFGFVHLLKGPVEVTDGEELADKSYVSADLTYIMGLCGEEVTADGETVACYAVAPMGDRFVMLRFDAALQEDVQTLCDATAAYLGGEEKVMRVHMPVRGMAVTAEAEVYELLQQWFQSNKGWMEQAGVVGSEPTEELYLSPFAVEVDAVGTLSGQWTVLLSALALLMVLYAAVELCFLLWGKKEKTPPAEKAREPRTEAPKEEAAEAAPTEEVTGDPAEDEPAEEVTGDPAEDEPAEETTGETAEEAAEEAAGTGEEKEEGHE